MKIPYRRRWLLRRMDRRMRRSDPHLAAMLAIFARLYASEVIISQEQAVWPGAREWRRLVSLLNMMVRAAAALIAGTGRASGRAARAGAMMIRRVSEAVRAALAISAPARAPVRRGDTGLPAG
jgi:hypothetical protein